MTVSTKLTVAGSGELARNIHDTAGRALDVQSSLWDRASDAPPVESPVFVVAELNEREAFVRSALEAGLTVASLPFRSSDAEVVSAVDQGKLKLVSTLQGIPALERLRADCRSGIPGRRYGVFAAHRLPRSAAPEARNRLDDLLVYTTSLLDAPIDRVRVTAASLIEGTPDAWFVILRCTDGTLMTLEVSAVLDDSYGPEGTLVVEVTGSEAVLRSEPHRQSVSVTGRSGIEHHLWYSGPDELLLKAALGESDTHHQANLMQTLHILDEAASADSEVSVSS